MTVAYSARDIPLVKNAGNALAASINLAWDFTGHDPAHLNGVPWVYAGATSPDLTPAGTMSLATIGGIPGTVAGDNSYYYNPSNPTDFGLQSGTGDFRTLVIVSTPGTIPISNNQLKVIYVRGASGDAYSIYVAELSGSGWYTSVIGSTACTLGATNSSPVFGANKRIAIWIQKVSGVVTVYYQNITDAGALTVRYLGGAACTAPMDAGYAAQVIANDSASGGGTGTGIALHAIVHWADSTTTANLQAIGDDFWNLSANTAAGANINLAVANASTPAALSTAAVTVAPPVAGVVNLAPANASTPAVLSTAAVSVVPAQGTLTSDVFRAWGSPAALAGLAIPRVVVARTSDGVVVLNLANQVADGTGQIVLVSASLVAGVSYMLATWNADGSARGLKAYTAT